MKSTLSKNPTIEDVNKKIGSNQAIYELKIYGDSIFTVIFCDVIITYIFYYSFDKGIDLLKTYNINFEEFEKLIKISSLDIKDKYSTKIKREIKAKIGSSKS